MVRPKSPSMGFLAFCLAILITASLADDRCTQQLVKDVDYGTCNQTSTRYFYDTKTKDCRMFSGCSPSSGESNNYADYNSCMGSCAGADESSAPSCSGKLKKGSDLPPCAAVSRSFHQAKGSGCMRFLGCPNDNGNNFPTVGHCRRQCEKERQVGSGGGHKRKLAPGETTRATAPSTASGPTTKPVMHQAKANQDYSDAFNPKIESGCSVAISSFVLIVAGSILIAAVS